jgi:hypothetical protein
MIGDLKTDDRLGGLHPSQHLESEPHCVALISMENQRHASTSAALLTGAQRLRRRDGGP